MSDYDLVQTTRWWIGVSLYHFSSGFVAREGISFLDKVRQVTKLAEFHDQMYMCGGLLAVDKGDDMWVMEVLQDHNLTVEVFLELRIELLQIDRFDGHVTRAPLEREMHISKKLYPRRCLQTQCTSTKDAITVIGKGLERYT